MIPDPHRLPAPSISRVEGAILMPTADGRHHACGVLDASGRPVPAARTRIGPNRFTADPAPPEGTPDRLPGSWLYAGVGRHHFGHFLLEALPRLWALDHLETRPDGIALVPMAGRDIAAVLARRHRAPDRGVRRGHAVAEFRAQHPARARAGNRPGVAGAPRAAPRVAGGRVPRTGRLSRTASPARGP